MSFTVYFYHMAYSYINNLTPLLFFVFVKYFGNVLYIDQAMIESSFDNAYAAF